MSQDWRRTREYRIWRVGVIRRDKVCYVCGSNKKRQAHHIDCGSYFPEKRFLLDNGVCLCSACHTAYHTDFNRSFRVKTDRYNFNNFLEIVNYLKNLDFKDISLLPK